MRLKNLIEQAILDRVFLGAAYAVGTAGGVEMGVAGSFGYGASPAVSRDSLFDLASLTKVVGTTSLAKTLVDDGRLELDRPVSDVLVEFKHPEVTPRHLLLHNSGLPAFRLYHEQFRTRAEVIDAIFREPLDSAPGATTVYSDLGMIVLGLLMETLTGQPLGELFRERIFAPLGMSQTGFNPSDRARCPYTEPVEDWRETIRCLRSLEAPQFEVLDGVRYTRGEVHDPTAFLMDGEAGHAGLFSTIEDMVRFGERMLSSSFGLFTRRASDGSSRALGWDTNLGHAGSAGPGWSERSFGHTGFTGTSIWVDPDAGRFAVLLTNRVHPSAARPGIVEFRRQFHASALYEFP